jgi:hypothetical protein
MNLSSRGDARAALADFGAAEEILKGTDEPLKLQQLLGLSADVLCCTGDLASADERARRLLRVAEEVHNERGKGRGLYLKGHLASLRGQHDEAQALLAAAARHSEQGGDLNYKLQADALRAFDLAIDGKVEEGLTLAQATAQEYARRRLLAPHACPDGVFLAVAAIARGRNGRLAPSVWAQVVRVRLLRWYQARGARLTRPLFRAGSAAVDVARGKLQPGVARFDEAVRAAEEAGLMGTTLELLALAKAVFPAPHRARYDRLDAALRQRLSDAA